MADDLGQVAIIVDTRSDLVWAEEQPGLSPGPRDQFRMLRADHTKVQEDLRSAIRQAQLRVGELEIMADSARGRGGIIRVSLPQRDVSGSDIDDILARARDIVRRNEAVAIARTRLRSYVIVTNPVIEQEQQIWVEREVVRLRAWVKEQRGREAPGAAAERGISAAAESRTHEDDEARLPLPSPGRRHRIAWESLDARQTTRAEAWINEIERLARELSNMRVRSHFHSPHQIGGTSSRRTLVDEAWLCIELERVSKQLDSLCAWPGDPTGLPGNVKINPRNGLLKGADGIVPAILAQCSSDFTPNTARRLTGSDWCALRAIERAVTVNVLVRVALDEARPGVLFVARDDLVHAANGNPESWGRLRSFCGIDTENAVSEHAGVDPVDERLVRNHRPTGGAPGRPPPPGAPLRQHAAERWPDPPSAEHRIEQVQSTREPDPKAPSEPAATRKRRHKGLTHDDWHEQAKSCKRLYSNNGSYRTVAKQKKLDVKTVHQRIADLAILDATGVCPICGAPSSAH